MIAVAPLSIEGPSLIPTTDSEPKEDGITLFGAKAFARLSKL
jgi:hypothetical protein